MGEPFVECLGCRIKPGSPLLCGDCLDRKMEHARTGETRPPRVWTYEALVAEYDRVSDRATLSGTLASKNALFDEADNLLYTAYWVRFRGEPPPGWTPKDGEAFVDEVNDHVCYLRARLCKGTNVRYPKRGLVTVLQVLDEEDEAEVVCPSGEKLRVRLEDLAAYYLIEPVPTRFDREAPV
jgi:hypothetical protein